jgi:hypothetical protein
MESEGRTSSSVRVPRTNWVVSAVTQRAGFMCDLTPYHTEAVQVVHYKVGFGSSSVGIWFGFLGVCTPRRPCGRPLQGLTRA